MKQINMFKPNNIVCIYNYVNMSNKVSIVKTDFWMERGVVAGSHHSPESFII